MTGFLVTIVVGLIVGLLARLIMPGKQAIGIIMTILLGVAGSLVATYGGQAIGWYAQGQPAGWIASVVGALVVLFVYQRVMAR